MYLPSFLVSVLEEYSNISSDVPECFRFEYCWFVWPIRLVWGQGFQKGMSIKQILYLFMNFCYEGVFDEYLHVKFEVNEVIITLLSFVKRKESYEFIIWL